MLLRSTEALINDMAENSTAHRSQRPGSAEGLKKGGRLRATREIMSRRQANDGEETEACAGRQIKKLIHIRSSWAHLKPHKAFSKSHLSYSEANLQVEAQPPPNAGEKETGLHSLSSRKRGASRLPLSDGRRVQKLILGKRCNASRQILINVIGEKKA